jgi:hypothetical protein
VTEEPERARSTLSGSGEPGNTQPERILARDRAGEVISYTPEEFGVGPSGWRGKILTVRRRMASTALQGLLVVVLVALVALGYRGEHDPSPGAWVAPALALALFINSGGKLRTERRAHALRQRHGLPAPAVDLTEESLAAGENSAAATGKKGMRKSFYRRSIETEAAKQGLTPQEYGVYKGSRGSVIKPYNTPGALLFLAILMTPFALFSSGAFLWLIRNGEGPGGEGWFALVISWVFTVWAWRYVYVEWRARYLRRKNGKTLKSD